MYVLLGFAREQFCQVSTLNCFKSFQSLDWALNKIEPTSPLFSLKCQISKNIINVAILVSLLVERSDHNISLFEFLSYNNSFCYPLHLGALNHLQCSTAGFLSTYTSVNSEILTGTLSNAVLNDKM